MRVAVLVITAIWLAACRPPGYGEEPDTDAGPGPDAAPGIDAAPAPDAGPDAAPVTCEASFRLEGHGTAASVWLTGDFVGWAGNPGDGAVALVLGGDGVWTGARTFDEGTYVYKFIVDGTSWIADPANPDTVDDGFGGVNSVYRCPSLREAR
jgi:hypothetical protein